MSEIFPDNTGETPPVVTPPVATTPQLSDEVAAMVGEGKKYATIEKALEALPHSQRFIEQLKAENEELRKKTEGAVSREEVYDTVQELLKQQQVTPPASGLDEQGVQALLDRALQEREARRIVQENEQTFKKALEGKYGEKAKEVYLSEAEKLGMDTKALDHLARTNPRAALKLLGVEGDTKSPKPTLPGSVNPQALASQNPPAPKQKSVMFGGKTKDIIEEWRRHGQNKE